jgi:hypothetical protein
MTMFLKKRLKSLIILNRSSSIVLDVEEGKLIPHAIWFMEDPVVMKKNYFTMLLRETKRSCRSYGRA